MTPSTATAVACSNIAFIKYWGNRDESLRLPVNGSISMNLAELTTRTSVHFDPSLTADTLLLNGHPAPADQTRRVSTFLDHVRALINQPLFAVVESENNFPAGSGIASSASAFAALAAAASTAIQLNLSEAQLSRLARLGSGSACRSIPAGFVEWLPGVDDASSYAVSIAPADHWDLVDLVAILDAQPKKVGSTEGHAVASTSPLQAGRVADTPRRLDLCRKAIKEKNFSLLAEIIEQDCLIMHSVMMTSSPTLMYWQPATLQLMDQVVHWREAGAAVAFTIDAGANVHLIAEAKYADPLRSELHRLSYVQNLFVTHPGGPAHLQ